MRQNDDHLLVSEGSSMCGTYLYKSKKDAEGIATMLGLNGVFQQTTLDGTFWSPGHNNEELQARIRKGIVLPPLATVPKSHLLSFSDFNKAGKTQT